MNVFLRIPRRDHQFNVHESRNQKSTVNVFQHILNERIRRSARNDALIENFCARSHATWSNVLLSVVQCSQANTRHLRIGRGNNHSGAQSSVWHVGGSRIAEYYTLA